jgi:hypothetical protein
MSQHPPEQPRRATPPAARQPEPDIYADPIESDTTAADLALVGATNTELTRRGAIAAVHPGGMAIGTLALGLVVFAVAVSVIVLGITGNTVAPGLGFPMLLLVIGTVLTVNAGVGLVRHRRQSSSTRRPR